MSKKNKKNIGHNSINKELLLSVVERVETLEEEKAGTAQDIKDVYAEAKGNGLDVKTIRNMVKLRAMDKEKLAEQEFLRDLYMQCLDLGPSMLE